MKTVEELSKDLPASPELQNKLESMSGEELAKFLEKNGCDEAFQKLSKYLKSQSEGELDDDDAAAVAGGFRYEDVPGILGLDPKSDEGEALIEELFTAKKKSGTFEETHPLLLSYIIKQKG